MILTKLLAYVIALIYLPITLIKIITALTIILDEWSGNVIKNFIKENTEDE